MEAHDRHWAQREPPPHGELLIDCEKDRTLRAVLVGMLRGGRSLDLTQGQT